eukprot:scaffold26871_cov147-Cylindrotheca_fusiformis.AAC.3
MMFLFGVREAVGEACYHVLKNRRNLEFRNERTRNNFRSWSCFQHALRMLGRKKPLGILLNRTSSILDSNKQQGKVVVISLPLKFRSRSPLPSVSHLSKP